MQTRHANSAPTVVGYQYVTVPTGYSTFTPVFKNCGNTSFKLGQITVCNENGVEFDDDPAGAGMCQDEIIVRKTKTGSALKVGTPWSYTSMAYDEREEAADFWGWNENREEPIAPGEGLIVNNIHGKPVIFKLKGPLDK